MRTEQLRSYVLDDELLVLPGTFDGLSASIAASIGFDAVYLGGFATGASLAASEPLTSLGEMCARTREVAHSVDVPLVVDGGAGFGNPVHTYRAVQELARSGANGIHLEDQVYPKRVHYHKGEQHMISPDEMARKIEVAAEARDEMDEDVLLIARTEAGRSTGTIEDAVERINRYFDAGAELGFVFPDGESELRFAARNADGPLMFFNSEFRENPSQAKLESMGYAVVSYGLTGTLAAVKQLRDAYESIHEQGSSPLGRAESEELYAYVNEVIGMERRYQIEESSGNR